MRLKALTILFAASFAAQIPGADKAGSAEKSARAKATPRSLFSKEFWGFYRWLPADDWQPLDVVQRSEEAVQVFRVICFEGWGKPWSVTICSFPSDEGWTYHSTGFTIQFQHRMTLGRRSFAVIHKEALDPKIANKLLNSKDLKEAFELEPPNAHPAPVMKTDQTVWVMERLGPKGYHLIVRTEVGGDVSFLFDDAKKMARTIFEKEISQLEELQEKDRAEQQKAAEQNTTKSGK